MKSKNPNENKKKTVRPLVIMAWVIGIVCFFYILLSSAYDDREKTSKSNVIATSEKKQDIYIPEICASDIYMNLEKKGFKCSGLRVRKTITAGRKEAYWECKEEGAQGLYVAEVIGHFPCEILNVQATSVYYGSGSGKRFHQDYLGYMASLPYKSSKPKETSDWVKSQIGKTEKSQKIVSKIKVELTQNKNGKAKILSLQNNSFSF